jgi:hypothetical protein
LFVRSSDRSWFVRPIVRSFVQIIFVQPLCCRNSYRLFVRSFDRSSVHSSYSSFVHSPYSSFVQIIFVQPLCCRNFDRSFVRSFDRSSVRSYFLFIVHRSFIRLLTSTIQHRTIHRHYSSLLLFIDDIYRYFFVVTIQSYYSSLLFIDHSITPNFNYSSIMLSSSPKTSQTNIPVIRTPVTVIFLLVRTSHLATHPKFL